MVNAHQICLICTRAALVYYNKRILVPTWFEARDKKIMSEVSPVLLMLLTGNDW
jgi:hypothetical protein